MKNSWVAGALIMTAGFGWSSHAAAQDEHSRTPHHAAARPASATATLQDAKGKTVGQVTLRETAAGVLLRADLSGVPAGTHAFHLHEVGKCDAPTFESAGAHFAPDGMSHGLLVENGPHAGDMPNLHVPAQGQFSIEMLNSRVTLSHGPRSIADNDGTALVIHAAGDDYRTDPAGEAGDRIACGVITVSR